MSKSIYGLIAGLFAFLHVAAQPVTFSINDLDADPGQTVDINFTVDDFTNVISVQYSVNWNPAILEFKELKNFNASIPGLNASVFNTTPAFVDQGQFTLSWIESSITPITIPDGSVMFTVSFEVVGAPCQNTAVAITTNPLDIEVSGENEVELDYLLNNGSVNIPGTGCAQDIEFIGNNVIGACGSNTCIQFTVENFETVGAMEFSLSYDPNVLQFTEFKNFAPLPGFGEGNTNLLLPGTLRVLWFDSNVENDTLPDGTVLFEICFDVIGSGGQSSGITFGNNPPPSITDIDGNPHVVDITPAVITAQCALEGFALIADTLCTMPNGEVCFDVKINDFDDIIALQFSMNWNPAVFEFDRVENFGIPGLDISGFGTPGFPGIEEGELVLSWIDLSLEGETLPDSFTIFTVCLNAVGAAGTSSPVTFTQNPLEIEIANVDSSITTYALLQGFGEIKVMCNECDDLSFTITPTSPNCPRECNGAINLEVIENCPETPTYVWNHGPTTQDVSELCSGTYTVTITLGNQVVIATATVTDPPSIAVTGTVVNPNPPGSNTGSVDITVTGGETPYTYLWSNNAQTQDISNVSAGVYNVTITDNNGCVFIPDPFVVGAEVVASITNVSCPGGNDGAINLSPAFGTSPYTFTWNTVPVQTTEDLNNLSAGTYCVTITDALSATRDTCFVVTEPADLVVAAVITNDVTENCQSGAIDLSVSGGTLPYTYLWSNGATTQDLNNLCGGQYCVTITYGQGCTFDTCFTVFSGNISINLVATQYGSYQVSCSGECDGEITAVISGGAIPFTFQWSNGATSQDIAGLCAGSYTLTVTDASGNSAISSITLNEAPPFALAYITTSPTDYVTSDGAIAVVVNGGTPPYTYEWTGPATGSTASLNNVPAGTYTIEITDAAGCTIRDSEQLLPELDIDCYTATKVFTPNQDGRNDYFIIACVLDFENQLYIFNRFGGLVYETDDYQNNWEGVDQDGQPVPDGGYHWVLEVTRAGGVTDIYKGTVNLVRTAD
jgi:gliding motility-associated-like protein